MWAIQTETTNEIIIVNMLYNWSYRYSSSHYRIIKCVDFESIHYVIKLDTTPSFKVFSEFDYMFLSIILLV